MKNKNSIHSKERQINYGKNKKKPNPGFCTKSNKKFYSGRTLQDHKRTFHSGEKTQCEKRFSSKPALHRHVYFCSDL